MKDLIARKIYIGFWIVTNRELVFDTMFYRV